MEVVLARSLWMVNGARSDRGHKVIESGCIRGCAVYCGNVSRHHHQIWVSLNSSARILWPRCRADDQGRDMNQE